MILCLFLNGCANSPVRNPFEGMREAKLGALPSPEKGSKVTVQTVWTHKQAKTVKGMGFPVQAAENRLYVVDQKGQIAALDQKTGRPLWQRQTDHVFSTGPAYSEGQIFVATKEAKVVAFDAENGKENWQAALSTETLVTPKAGQGIVLVNSLDGSLHALDARDGVARWVLERSTPSLMLRGGSKPAIIDQTLLAGFSNGKLIAIDLATGQVQWERVITNPHGRSELHRMVDITADPIVQGEIVFVATYQGHVVALNWQTGAMIWQRDISSYQNLAADAMAVYVTDKENNLWAIDGQTGATLWKQSTLKDRYITAPALFKDTLFVGDKGGVLHWIDKQDGRLLGHKKVANKLQLDPLVADDLVILQGQNGKMTALKLIAGA